DEVAHRDRRVSERGFQRALFGFGGIELCWERNHGHGCSYRATKYPCPSARGPPRTTPCGQRVNSRPLGAACRYTRRSGPGDYEATRYSVLPSSFSVDSSRPRASQRNSVRSLFFRETARASIVDQSVAATLRASAL